MKVVELQNAFGIDSLTVVERPEPKPAPAQVLIRMRAWSLNYRDLMVAKGLYNPKLKFPIVPLSDGVGEVVALGPGVNDVRIGARVAGTFLQKWVAGEVTDAKAKSALGGGGPGVLAEYVVLEADGLIPVPEHLSDEEAATLPCAALTSWHALVSAGHVQAGDTVLVQGTGGVSLFALQFARMHGARVIATSSSDDKLRRACELGASDGINYKTTPDWDEAARALTGGVGVDHVIEVGGAGTLGKSMKAVRMGGRISLIGVLSGAAAGVNPTPLLMKTICLQGIFVGSREMFEAMNRAIALHKMRPVVDRVFGFAEIREALKYMESAGHFGKICLRL
ncbi:MAG: NAD(P)-dependent alcohol dehydrogenase [Planctomycetes bacterium]|nr:NAD(P)-dependent alcohol dehydrogenase [Planctomycetota bacterium]